MNRTVECIYDEKPKSRNQLLREKLLLLEEHVRVLEAYEARHPPDLAPSSPSWRTVAIHSAASALPSDYVSGISCIFPSKSRWLRRTPQPADSIKLANSPPDSPQSPYAWHSPENSPDYIQELPELPSYPLDPSPFSVWQILHDLPESVLQETSSFLSVGAL